MSNQPKEGKAKGKQLRWTAQMSTMALQILVDEAMEGNKPSSTFKTSSFIRVAKEISEEFSVNCLPDHVENHLRTIKKYWKIITILRSKSGFGWNEEMKMVIAERQVYDEEVAAHSSHAKFLNKKIDMYDEMSIVVGKDIATGTYAKSFSNINIDETVDLEGNCLSDDISMYDDVRTSKDTATSVSSGKRSHRKRSRTTNDEAEEQLYEHMANMTSAIRDLGTASTKAQKIFVDNLMQDVMNVEGYDKYELSEVFDYLVQNELIATAFMAESRTQEILD